MEGFKQGHRIPDFCRRACWLPSGEQQERRQGPWGDVVAPGEGQGDDGSLNTAWGLGLGCGTDGI